MLRSAESQGEPALTPPRDARAQVAAGTGSGSPHVRHVTYPIVLRGGFTRRPRPDDPFLVDLAVETRISAPGAPPEVRCRPVDWRQVFGRSRPLRVEIGFGRSDFLIEVARRDPEFDYVGFEYSPKRVLAFLRKVHRHGVTNVRAVCCDVTAVLDRAFAPATIDRFFILFPDPWPKRRHAAKRFIQARNAAIMHDLLRPGGGLTLRTDDAAYARQMVDVLDGHPGLARAGAAPREPFMTLYERKFTEMGRRIHYLEYVREEGSRPSGVPTGR